MISSTQLANTLKKLRTVLPIFNIDNHAQYLQFQVPILIGENEKERTDECYLGVPVAYQKQILLATVQLTSEYPTKCPSICLQKKLIFHPFVSQQEGSVCFSTRDKEWKAANADDELIMLLTIGIPTLLGTFSGDNPHNTEAAALQKKSHKSYLETANKVFLQQKNDCTNLKLARLMRESKYTDYPADFKSRAHKLAIMLPEIDLGTKVQAPKASSTTIIAEGDDADLGL